MLMLQSATRLRRWELEMGAAVRLGRVSADCAVSRQLVRAWIARDEVGMGKGARGARHGAWQSW